MLDSDRFDTPGKLVAYFGILPIQAASGVDRDGQPRGPKRYVMSRRGNDLVRRYLWMAALSAVRFNPAVRALYARVVAKHPDKKAIAIGHAMRKLLHLAFAVWKSGRPFDPKHYGWETPAHGEATDNILSATAQATSDRPVSSENQAAGHTPSAEPAPQAAAAARNTRPPSPAAETESTSATDDTSGDDPQIDFAHLKTQLSMARVLDQLELSSRLRGSGPQRRGPCPLHRGDARGRTFSVNLDRNVFQCFDNRCCQKGDVIDLWASVNGLSLREAAIDLVNTFALEPTPQRRTEKRNG